MSLRFRLIPVGWGILSAVFSFAASAATAPAVVPPFSVASLASCVPALLAMSAPLDARQAARDYSNVLSFLADTNSLPTAVYKMIAESKTPFDPLDLGVDALPPEYRLAYQRVIENAVGKLLSSADAWDEVRATARILSGSKEASEKRAGQAREETRMAYFPGVIGKLNVPDDIQFMYAKSNREIVAVIPKGGGAFAFALVTPKQITEIGPAPRLNVPQLNKNDARARFFESTDGRLFFAYCGEGSVFGAVEVGGSKPPVTVPLTFDSQIKDIYIDERPDGVRFVTEGGSGMPTSDGKQHVYVVDYDNRRGGVVYPLNDKLGLQVGLGFRNQAWESSVAPATFEWTGKEFKLVPAMDLSRFSEPVRYATKISQLKYFETPSGERLLAGTIESARGTEGVVYDVKARKYLMRQKLEPGFGFEQVFFSKNGNGYYRLRPTEDGIPIIDVSDKSLFLAPLPPESTFHESSFLETKDGRLLFLVTSAGSNGDNDRWVRVFDVESKVMVAEIKTKKIMSDKALLFAELKDGRVAIFFQPYVRGGSGGQGMQVLQVFGPPMAKKSGRGPASETGERTTCVPAIAALAAPTTGPQAAGNFILAMKAVSERNGFPPQVYQHIVDQQDPFNPLEHGIDGLVPEYRQAFQRLFAEAVTKLAEDPASWREVQEAARDLLGIKTERDETTRKAKEQTKMTYVTEDLGKLKVPFETSEIFLTSKGEAYGVKKKTKNKYVFIKVDEMTVTEIGTVPDYDKPKNDTPPQGRFLESSQGRVFFAYRAPGPAFAVIEMGSARPPVSVDLKWDSELSDRIYIDERPDGVRFVVEGGGERQDGHDNDRVYIVDYDNQRTGFFEIKTKRGLCRLVPAFRNQVWEVSGDPSTIEWNADRKNFERVPVLNAKQLPAAIREGFMSLSLSPYSGKPGELLLVGEIDGSGMFERKAVIYDVVQKKMLLEKTLRKSSGDAHQIYTDDGNLLYQLAPTDDGVPFIDVAGRSFGLIGAELNGAVDMVQTLKLRDGRLLTVAVNRDANDRSGERWFYVLDPVTGVMAAKVNIKNLKSGGGILARELIDGRIILYFDAEPWGKYGPGFPVLQIFGPVKKSKGDPS